MVLNRDNSTERTDYGYVNTPGVFNGENFPVYGTTHFYITTTTTTTHHPTPKKFVLKE